MMELSMSFILKFGTVASFVLGCLIGSFLNVCIYRIPLKKSIVFPPSSCPACGRMIKWYENIPVISYLFLRARCAGCGKRISWVYPAVELLTGVLFMCVFIWNGLTVTLPFLWFYVAALVVIAGIDITHQIVPDRISIPGILIGLVYGYLDPSLGIGQSFAGMVAGGGSLLLVIFVFFIITRKIGMGGGDVKLLAMIGAFVGPWKLPGILLVASVLGIIAFGIMKLAGKKKIAASITAEDIRSDREEDLDNAIYFGPFLAIAGIVFLFIPPWQGFSM